MERRSLAAGGRRSSVAQTRPARSTLATSRLAEIRAPMLYVQVSTRPTRFADAAGNAGMTANAHDTAITSTGGALRIRGSMKQLMAAEANDTNSANVHQPDAPDPSSSSTTGRQSTSNARPATSKSERRASRQGAVEPGEGFVRLGHTGTLSAPLSTTLAGSACGTCKCVSRFRRGPVAVSSRMPEGSKRSELSTRESLSTFASAGTPRGGGIASALARSCSRTRGMGDAKRDEGQDKRLFPATLTVAEAASVLGVSKSTAYELARTGALPAIRLGRRIVVPIRALESLLAAAGSPSSDPLELSAGSVDSA